MTSDNSKTVNLVEVAPDSNGHANSNLRAEEMRRYLDTLYGDRSGVLHFAVGYEPYFNAQGAYRFGNGKWIPGAVLWPSPEEIDDLIELLLRESEEGDVYVCPYLMVGDERAKGLAVDHRWVHADIDREPFDAVKAGKLDSIGGFAIASGSDDHVHAYVPLAESVPAPQHEAMCRGLGVYLGGADPGKCSDNDVLRPPGTYNHKPRVRDGSPMALVRWLP
jgi:hypothetical protein